MAGATTAVDTEGRGAEGRALPWWHHSLGMAGWEWPLKLSDLPHPQIRETEQVKPKEGQDKAILKGGPRTTPRLVEPRFLCPGTLFPWAAVICAPWVEAIGGTSGQWSEHDQLLPWLGGLVCREPFTWLLGVPCLGLSPLAGGVELADQPAVTGTKAGLGRAREVMPPNPHPPNSLPCRNVPDAELSS